MSGVAANDKVCQHNEYNMFEGFQYSFLTCPCDDERRFIGSMDVFQMKDIFISNYSTIVELFD